MDEPDVIAAAAADIGLHPEAFPAWMADAATKSALREDMDLAHSIRSGPRDEPQAGDGI